MDLQRIHSSVSSSPRQVDVPSAAQILRDAVGGQISTTSSSAHGLCPLERAVFSASRIASVCVRRESPDGKLLNERAMLIQAKIASKYNKIPSGVSTRKERLLFESCDRHEAITLYLGVGRNSPIGTYYLGSCPSGRGYGLRDCASFLLMARAPWQDVADSVAPLQVGWPLNSKRTEIKPAYEYLDSIIEMLSDVAPQLGREVKTGAGASSCVWTRMVNDLRGKYEAVTMQGYNGQARVTTSARSITAYQYLRVVMGMDPGLIDAESLKSIWASLRLFPVEKAWLCSMILKGRSLRASEKLVKYLDVLNCIFSIDRSELELWRDEPPNPATPKIDDFNESGPHISTLIVTVRGEGRQ